MLCLVNAAGSILVPVISAMAQQKRTNPSLLVVPTVMACSLAFMLPTATAPNAIAYSTGLLTIPRMLRTGAALNVAGVVVVVVAMLTLGDAVYEVNVGEFPDWADLIFLCWSTMFCSIFLTLK